MTIESLKSLASDFALPGRRSPNLRRDRVFLSVRRLARSSRVSDSSPSLDLLRGTVRGGVFICR